MVNSKGKERVSSPEESQKSENSDLAKWASQKAEHAIAQDQTLAVAIQHWTDQFHELNSTALEFKNSKALLECYRAFCIAEVNFYFDRITE